MVVTVFLTVRKEHCPSSKLYDDLRRLYPEGDRRAFFCVNLPAEDRRATAVLNALESGGMKPWDRRRDMVPGEFSLELRRSYDKSDWEPAEFLQPRPKLLIDDDSGRSMTGVVLVQPRILKCNLTVAQADWPAIVVSEKLKSQILEGGMQHIMFRPVGIIGKPEEGYAQSWYRLTTSEAREKAKSATITKFAEGLWELSSDLVLPRLSPQCQLQDEKGNPVRDDFSTGTFLREDFYKPPELHYTRGSIQNAGPFDLALTYEPLSGWYPTWQWYRHLVASKRFYEFCKARKLKMDWIPVRIDPD